MDMFRQSIMTHKLLYYFERVLARAKFDYALMAAWHVYLLFFEQEKQPLKSRRETKTLSAGYFGGRVVLRLTKLFTGAITCDCHENIHRDQSNH
jgi:hypothetical protein